MFVCLAKSPGGSDPLRVFSAAPDQGWVNGSRSGGASLLVAEVAQATKHSPTPALSVDPPIRATAERPERPESDLINGKRAQGDTTRWIPRHVSLLARPSTEPARGPRPQVVS